MLKSAIAITDNVIFRKIKLNFLVCFKCISCLMITEKSKNFHISENTEKHINYGKIIEIF